MRHQTITNITTALAILVDWSPAESSIGNPYTGATPILEEESADAVIRKRWAALAETLSGIAARLRG